MDALAIILAKEKLPLHLGQRLAFTHFLLLLEPRWSAIHRNILTTGSKKKIPNLMDSIPERVMDVWNETNIAATIDIWSSNVGDRYCSMSIHWVMHD